MMSGLLALLDDVAAIAKVAAASIDDIAAGAAKAGAKAAGVLIDDAAVTPKYLIGFEASRELPIIWRIARGSLKNKLIILLPAALLLANFAPWLLTPLLMIGGAYLCFEGAEKVFHWIFPHGSKAVAEDMDPGDPLHIEEERVSGAIKTDFILSAEIMAISLAAIPESSFWLEAITLAIVAIVVTLAVYGAVALIVKMDDAGVYMTANGRLAATRSLGRGLVLAMPILMTFLSIVGTAAMLWVGGQIVVHGMEVLGAPWLYDQIHHLAEMVGAAVPASTTGIVTWAITAFFDGVFGLALGLLLIPLATHAIVPLYASIKGV
jgi:predicted DNA repair protein MutK